jgi:NAD-dependent DNA ligase
MEKLLDNNFKPEDILNTKGIAEKTANAIHSGIQANLDQLRENAKWFNVVKKEISNNSTNHKSSFIGKTFCITGSLEFGTRKDYEGLISEFGGRIAGVTQNLDFLVTNDEDTSSSKMKKTLEFNAKFHNAGIDKKIIIITEQQLREMMELTND